MQSREHTGACLASSRYLDTLSAEQLAALGDNMEKRYFEEGDEIVCQGEMGDELFIVQSGKCAASISTLADAQEHRYYHPGDLFGERALVYSSPRAATVTALVTTEVLCLSRKRLERILGPLSWLHQQHYTTDPRKMIADFYMLGDSRGPCGACSTTDVAFNPEQVPEEERTEWFAVYRPTSRDAIAKMLGGEAVGKGLNVKAKSAKFGRNSGFVPFMQISENEDKAKLSPPDPYGRVMIFFKTEHDREIMSQQFVNLLDPKKGLDIMGDRVIDYIDMYEDAYGLDIPEAVINEVFIHTKDITFQFGWETGRKSAPAFQDMNAYGLRSNTEPKIVLYQSDLQDPSNPHGLLIAYAERNVRPVVSDFDTFLIGSRGMVYEALPPEQVKQLHWVIDKTEEILATPGPGSWTSRWLDILKTEKPPCKVPKYGYGDPVSYRLISQVIDALYSSL